jgi:hypothetical protein
MNAGGNYIVRIFNGSNTCFTDQTVTVAAATPCCQIITNPTATQTLCSGEGGTINVKTDLNTTNSIRFIQFTSDQMAGTTPTAAEAAAIYAGTALATVTPTGSGSPYTATYMLNTTDFATPLTYYMYAILDPAPGGTCYPAQEIKVIIKPLPAAITLTPTSAICTGGTPNNNGTIVLDAFTDATHYGISTLDATSYDGANFSTATAIVAGTKPTLQSGILNAGGTYIVRIFNGSNTCYADQSITVATAPQCCQIINQPTTTQTVCLGENGTNITVETDLNTTNSIRFVQFTSDQMAGATPTAAEAAAIYAGTALETVTPAGASSPYTATYTWSNAHFATSGTYYIYAILNPNPGGTCYPVQEIKIIVKPLPSTVTLTPTPATCTGGTPNGNGTITLDAFTDATHYGISTLNAVTYDGASFASATPTAAGATIQSSILNAGGKYIVRLFNGSNTCYIDKTVTVAAATPCCQTILNPTTTQTVCSGSSGTDITVETDLNTTNSIQFVQFTSNQIAGATPTAAELATIYAGTVIATVTPTGGASPYTATYTWSKSDFLNPTATPITYYVYAILNPDGGANCRPIQSILVTVQQCCATNVCLGVETTRN